VSPVRILGFGFAVTLLALSVLARGRGRLRRGETAAFGFFSLLLMWVSLDPGIVAAFTDLLVGKYERTGRILSLAILSNFFLVLVIVTLLTRVNRLDSRLSRTIQTLAVQACEATGDRRGAGRKEIAIVIPAYNEAENLPHVVRALPKTVWGREVEAIVCVDGATDKTEQVAGSLGCLTVVSPLNLGGGAALRMGFTLAASRGATIVVTMDADGQHLPSEIDRLVRPIVDGVADVVIGSRILGSYSGGSPIRRLGLSVFNSLMSLLMLRRITDCSSGFRAIRLEALSRLALEEDQFHTSELIIEAFKKRLRIVEVPVTIVGRAGGKSKKPDTFRYGWGFSRAIFRAWWR
jgi:hypothetical protein